MPHSPPPRRPSRACRPRTWAAGRSRPGASRHVRSAAWSPPRSGRTAKRPGRAAVAEHDTTAREIPDYDNLSEPRSAAEPAGADCSAKLGARRADALLARALPVPSTSAGAAAPLPRRPPRAGVPVAEAPRGGAGVKRNLHAGRPTSGGLSLNVFTEAELDDIHLGSLEVLERTGVWVEADDALDILGDGGCVVDRETRMVRIPPHLVEDAIRSAPPKNYLCGRDPEHGPRPRGRPRLRLQLRRGHHDRRLAHRRVPSPGAAGRPRGRAAGRRAQRHRHLRVRGAPDRRRRRRPPASTSGRRRSSTPASRSAPRRPAPTTAAS